MYLDATSLGMFLTYLMKGNASTEVGEIVVVSWCFASCTQVEVNPNYIIQEHNNAPNTPVAPVAQRYLVTLCHGGT